MRWTPEDRRRLTDMRAQHMAWLRYERGKTPHNRRPIKTSMGVIRVRARRRAWNQRLRDMTEHWIPPVQHRPKRRSR